MSKFRRIGILTSGGDAPGMNAAIRAVTRSAIERGVEVMGIYEGYTGLISGQMKLFGPRDVSNIVNKGGTILYSARCPEFKTREGLEKAIASCRENQIDGIVAIGGDGTFRGATELTELGVPCIGLPGTIDNDIASTDYTIGYDTAVNTAVEMVDRLRDTSESHARCNVVEVMGRNSGYIALSTGISVGASAIAIDEIPFDEDAAIQKMKSCRANGKRNFLVIVAEGLPGYAEKFTKTIEEKTGIESRFTRLGHVVRGGNPCARDRIMATRMGEEAVELLLKGESNLVVGTRHGEIVATEIGFALITDRMYKGTLKEGNLDKYTPAQIAQMKEICAARTADIQKLYDIADITSRN